MTIRRFLTLPLLCAAAALSSCGDERKGPIQISAIGEAPKLADPNRGPMDAPEALLVEATAQGLVRYDAAGQIEPALAQSWIVSDDGLRYTFRLSPATWENGDPVKAVEIVERLSATAARASKNPLKPFLLAIDKIESMTPQVLEISLKAPRPNFLQLLAQPEMAILRQGAGTGPYRSKAVGGVLTLTIPRDPEAEAEAGAKPDAVPAEIILRGERAGLAVARFADKHVDWVTGGTFADLPIARAAKPGDALKFDPVNGLLGLSFVRSAGPWASAAARDALAMALDRDAIVAAFDVPALRARTALAPAGLSDLQQPEQPQWAAQSLADRRLAAAARIRELGGNEPPNVSVYIPDSPGGTLLFALLRRDWAAIGVTAERATGNARADLRLVDEVAPANLSTWYLRRFSCESASICSSAADRELRDARISIDPRIRAEHIANADRLIAAQVPFITIAAPVRWSLVDSRLRGYSPNPFARRHIGSLAARP